MVRQMQFVWALLVAVLLATSVSGELLVQIICFRYLKRNKRAAKVASLRS
jgi:H+/Cl- antiporter ClcA